VTTGGVVVGGRLVGGAGGRVVGGTPGWVVVGAGAVVGGIGTSVGETLADGLTAGAEVLGAVLGAAGGFGPPAAGGSEPGWQAVTTAARPRTATVPDRVLKTEVPKIELTKKSPSGTPPQEHLQGSKPDPGDIRPTPAPFKG
jgi:hypothetical protein